MYEVNYHAATKLPTQSIARSTRIPKKIDHQINNVILHCTCRDTSDRE